MNKNLLYLKIKDSLHWAKIPIVSFAKLPLKLKEPLGNETSKRVQACDLLEMNNFWEI